MLTLLQHLSQPLNIPRQRFKAAVAAVSGASQNVEVFGLRHCPEMNTQYVTAYLYSTRILWGIHRLSKSLVWWMAGGLRRAALSYASLMLINSYIRWRWSSWAEGRTVRQFLC